MNVDLRTTPPVPIPENVSAWFEAKFIKPSLLGRLLYGFGGSLRAPQIFTVLKPRPAYRFAAMDAWRRMMWRHSGLERLTREAIAVAVSIANKCVY